MPSHGSRDSRGTDVVPGRVKSPRTLRGHRFGVLYESRATRRAFLEIVYVTSLFSFCLCPSVFSVYFEDIEYSGLYNGGDTPSV